MRQFFKFWWLCVRTAFRGNTAFANDWQWLFGVPVCSGLAVFAARQQGISELTTGNVITDAVLAALGAFVVTWLVAFAVRVLNAPMKRSWSPLCSEGGSARRVSFHSFFVAIQNPSNNKTLRNVRLVMETLSLGPGQVLNMSCVCERTETDRADAYADDMPPARKVLIIDAKNRTAMHLNDRAN